MTNMKESIDSSMDHYDAVHDKRQHTFPRSNPR